MHRNFIFNNKTIRKLENNSIIQKYQHSNYLIEKSKNLFIS
jgi:hypothetical protein